MYSNKIIFPLSLLFLAILLVIIFPYSRFDKHRSPDPKVILDGPATGASLAMDYIGAVRTYPKKQLPAQGFSEAFQLSKKLKSKSLTEANVWNTMGPTNIGGRTLSFAIHPVNTDTVFAGSASGGLWKSTTGGVGLNAWEYISTGFPVLGVGAIAIDPSNPEVLFIGTGENYGSDVSMPGIGPIRTTRGSYGIGILKSTDGGNSWEKSLDWSLNQRTAVQKIQVNPLRSETIWAATTEGGYRSRDGGSSWVKVHDVVMATDVVIDPSDTSTVFFANGGMGSLGHGIYRTENAGLSFEKLGLASSGGPSTFLGKVILDISKTNPNIIMASIGSSNGSISGSERSKTWLMKSEDGGDTWTVSSSSINYSSFQGWYSHSVAINPFNPNEVFTTGQPQVLFKSTNGGPNLDTIFAARSSEFLPDIASNVYPNLINWADHHEIVYHPKDPSIIYFLNDGGIFRTTDGGITLENCNSGYQTVQFYNGVSNSDINENLFLGGLQDNNSIIYEGDLAWRRGWAGDGGWTALNQNNNNIAFLSAQFGQAVASFDLFTSSQFGDRSFRPSFDVFPTQTANFITPMILSPADNTTAYMAGEIIFKTTNNGLSWNATNGGLALDGNAMSAMAGSHQDADLIYVASSPKVTRPNLYRTENGGDSWIKITGTLPDRFPTDIAVDPTNDDILYVTFGGFGTSHVFKSSDKGENWNDIGGGLPDIPTWSVTVDPKFPNHIYVGNEIGVYQSLNGGSTWEDISTNLPDAVFAMDLVISKSNRTLRLATHGNGAYETNLPQSSSIETGSEIPGVIELGNNYPNPFNPSTVIPYELSKKSFVALRIYDVSGKLIKTLVNREQGVGEFFVLFDASGLPSGTYFYQLKTGNESVTKKMLLIK